MHALRARVKKDIVCEFFPPARRGRDGATKGGDKVIILCGGAPSYPGQREALMEFLSKKGYWTFIPRYRGTWESGGSFLRISPHRDVADVIDQLSRGYRDLWSGKTHRLRRPEVYLIGASFGGAAAILASRDPRVKKVIALSPVTDWRAETRAESFVAMKRFTRTAFNAAYRGTERDWNKLTTGKFYNPMNEIGSIDGKKLLIVHAKDDKIVYADTSVSFARATDAQLVLLPRGGHLSLSNIAERKFWTTIGKFFGEETR